MSPLFAALLVIAQTPEPWVFYGYHVTDAGDSVFTRYEVVLQGSQSRIGLGPLGRAPMPFDRVTISSDTALITFRWPGRAYGDCRVERQSRAVWSGTCRNAQGTTPALALGGVTPDLGQDLSASATDVAILDQAARRLASESAWNRADERVCDDDIHTQKWSLFCALFQGSIDEARQYLHRRPGGGVRAPRRLGSPAALRCATRARRYFQGWPTMRITLTDRVVSDSHVVQRERRNWTTPTGPREESAVAVYRVRHGRIRRIWHLPLERDPALVPRVERPAFSAGKRPVVHIDEAHYNLQTAEGNYWTLAELLRRDGFLVRSWEAQFTSGTLDSVRMLVIANALARRDVGAWELPTPSAFTADEIVRAALGVAAFVRVAGTTRRLAVPAGDSAGPGRRMVARCDCEDRRRTGGDAGRGSAVLEFRLDASGRTEPPICVEPAALACTGHGRALAVGRT